VSASRTKVSARDGETGFAFVVVGTDDDVIVVGGSAVCDEELHAVRAIATVNQAAVTRTRIIA